MSDTAPAPDAALRRRAARAVRRGELPTGEPDRALTLDAAHRVLRWRWLALLWGLLVLSQVGLLRLSETSAQLVLHAVAAVLFLVVLVLQLRSARGARKVLAQT